jgi:hypothetical protein
MLTKGVGYPSLKKTRTQACDMRTLSQESKTCNMKNIPDEKDGGHVVGSNLLLALSARAFYLFL